MGRHSAPDDSDEEVGSAGIAVAPDPELAAVIESRGRHSRSDEPDTDIDTWHTERIAAVTDEPSDAGFTLDLTEITAPVPLDEPPAEPAPALDKKAAKAEAKAAAAAAKAQQKSDEKSAKADRKADRKARESDTRADLRILRQHAAVRAQAIAAVLASFLVYTLVMIVLGHTASYLLWLWVPIVIAGVLVGVVLDLAHRRIAKRGGQPGR